MKVKNFLLISMLLSLSFLVVACDDNTTTPNNNNNISCGNDVKEGTEECDGTDLNGLDCNGVVPGTVGTLSCNADCTLNVDQCAAAECGDGVKNGNEECDGTDFGGDTCETVGDFSGGDIACTDVCTIDTAACVPNCNVEGFFSDCNGMGGANECCPMNGMPTDCTTFWQDGQGRCLQTCGGDGDCGWNNGCVAQGHCFYNFCGLGSQGSTTPINGECTVGSGRQGWCYPLWRAMDDSGICFESGTVEHNGACVRDDEIDGTTGVDASTQCNMGICITDDASVSNDGHCVAYCDPNEAFDGNDGCPANWNCLNYSGIDFNETYDDGVTPNPNFLFREADYGVCYPMQDGLNPVLDTALVTCNLLTGHLMKDASAMCDAGQACKYVGLGTLIGVCADYDATTTKTLGDTCTLPQNQGDLYQCGAGDQCFIADPFNDPNQADPAMACARLCDGATYDGTANGCEGLTTTGGTPFVCLTASRFFTADHELPTSGTAPNTEVETSPSRLGFCVAPPQ